MTIHSWNGIIQHFCSILFGHNKIKTSLITALNWKQKQLNRLALMRTQTSSLGPRYLHVVTCYIIILTHQSQAKKNAVTEANTSEA